MSEMAIVNASPLIFLARTQFLPLLQLAAPEVLVPTAVAGEIKARGTVDPASASDSGTPPS
jgi:hypothetical protein